MTEDQKYAEAREICARVYRLGGPSSLVARKFREGAYDGGFEILNALAALNRGIEIERARIMALLREENGQCDCFAREEGECACGAWDDSKTMSVIRLIEAIEIGKGGQ